MTKEQLQTTTEKVLVFGERLLKALAKPEVTALLDRALEHSQRKAAERSFAGRTSAVLGVVRDPAVNAALTVAFGFAAETVQPIPKKP